jgi:hypothetical protein
MPGIDGMKMALFTGKLFLLAVAPAGFTSCKQAKQDLARVPPVMNPVSADNTDCEKSGCRFNAIKLPSLEKIQTEKRLVRSIYLDFLCTGPASISGLPSGWNFSYENKTGLRIKFYRELMTTTNLELLKEYQPDLAAIRIQPFNGGDETDCASWTLELDTIAEDDQDGIGKVYKYQGGPLPSGTEEWRELPLKYTKPDVH